MQKTYLRPKCVQVLNTSIRAKVFKRIYEKGHKVLKYAKYIFMF